MKRYDLDLFDAMDHDVVPDAAFARRLFGFLGKLHEDAGMFHGDIKPENICMDLCRLDDLNVKVDLDSWVLVDWESARTHGATFTGPYTPDYTPPREAPSRERRRLCRGGDAARREGTRPPDGRPRRVPRRTALGGAARKTPSHREGSRGAAVGGYAATLKF